jgi:DNA-binding response OmpR family regulator
MRPTSRLPVLVVADEPQLLHSVSVALSASGFPEVITLEDARNVIPLLGEQAIGAILLDLSISAPRLTRRRASRFRNLW